MNVNLEEHFLTVDDFALKKQDRSHVYSFSILSLNVNLQKHMKHNENIVGIVTLSINL